MRYAKIRLLFGVICGLVAGLAVISSMQVGAGLAFGVNATAEWGWGFWGNHWAWRTVWSAAATYLGAFIAGMIARERGPTIGILSAIPSAIYWGFVAFVGWTGRMDLDVPLGYKIAASVLVVATLPIGSAGGVAGEGYGEVNSQHFDSRRRCLLGIRWYHFIWLPFVIHFIVAQTTWAAMYGFGWIAAAWKASQSIFVMFPMLFTMAMLGTLQLVAIGAFKAYTALGGFEEATTLPVSRRVLKYGLGFPLLAALAQLGLVAVHYGLGRIFG